MIIYVYHQMCRNHGLSPIWRVWMMFFFCIFMLIISFPTENFNLFINLSLLLIWLFDSTFITPIQLVNNTSFLQNVQLHLLQAESSILTTMSVWTYTMCITHSFSITQFFRILTAELNTWVFVLWILLCIFLKICISIWQNQSADYHIESPTVVFVRPVVPVQPERHHWTQRSKLLKIPLGGV